MTLSWVRIHVAVVPCIPKTHAKRCLSQLTIAGFLFEKQSLQSIFIRVSITAEQLRLLTKQWLRTLEERFLYGSWQFLGGWSDDCTDVGILTSCTKIPISC